jgi:ubiquinone/menaquinone biosynthesis C-methylase UbiE
MPRDWEGFMLEDHPFVDFTAGDLVMIGGELSRLRCARARGADVAQAAAEQLPFRSGAADGVVCKVVVPYTDERKAIAEIGRVPRARGRAMLCLHGTGYYLHYLLKNPSWRQRVYASELSSTPPSIGSSADGSPACWGAARSPSHVRD